VLSSLRHPDEQVPDAVFFLTVFGRLWAAGVDVDLARAGGAEKRRRVHLPTYSFQHQRYFIEPGKAALRDAPRAKEPTRSPNLDDWFYRPTWIAKVAEPSAKTEPKTWLLFADHAGLGDDLAGRLRAAGHQVVLVRPSDAYYQLGPTEYRLSPEHGKDGYDALVRDLLASGRMPDRIAHLWLVAADDDLRPGSSVLHRNQERGFYSLLFLAQALAEQATKRAVHLVVVSSGMQQVDDEPVPHPDQATVLGPCKVIPRELPDFTCSSVDVALPRDKKKKFGSVRRARLEGLSSQLLVELTTEPANRVVAIRGQQRFEQTYERFSPDAEPSRRPLELRRGGTYLITGGFGGIGRTVARHLASRERVKLVLMSRSELPERSDWDAWLRNHDTSHPTSRKIVTIRELEAGGTEVEAFAADVTDLEKMRRGLEAVERRFGPLHGVIHAAGTMKDELLQTKTQSSVESIFGPKVYGTLVLDTLLANVALDFFLVFSSTSTVTGPIGQIDYAASNAFLNAYAESRRHARGPGDSAHPRKTISINWGVWNEVGMAADRAAALTVGETRSTAPLPIHHPLLQSRGGEGDKHVFFGSFAPRAQWILNEHRTVDGRALVPGTAYLEMARAALEEVGERLPFVVRDLFFLRPLAVSDDGAREVRTRLRANEQGYDFEVQSRPAGTSNGSGWEINAQAKLVLGQGVEDRTLDLAEIAGRCRARFDRDSNGIKLGQEVHLTFGPRWRALHEAAYGEHEALGHLELPESFQSDLQAYRLHPALLDVATGFAMDIVDGYDQKALFVPVSYGRVVVHAPLAPRVASWVRNRASDGSTEFASFDIVITDESGKVLVEIDQLTLRKLQTTTDFAVASETKPAIRDVDAVVEVSVRAKSPAELAFLRQLALGIAPAEGCEILDRTLSKIDGPVVVASSLDLAELVAHAEQTARETRDKGDPGATFARPELQTSYVAPRDDIERTLVGYWQELLGVDKVGVDDSFFDLGGHSLIAVRLFAKIKSAYRLDYPISVLFEAPTIAGCAKLIKSAVGDAVGESPETTAAHRTRYTHLVAMHGALAKRADQRTPFFLVAGMFGNVLNLRHLAHLIGQERRFYGLQARGLYGDHTPHETFEAMAVDYIAELRTVQPRGPYLLGGFSGGGITAYEMARQLTQAGETVALLAFLDTPLPTTPPLTSRDRFMLHAQHFRERGVSHLVDWVRSRYRWETSGRRRADPTHAKKPFDFHSEIIESAFRRACAEYKVPELPLAITLFRPKLDEHAVLGPSRVINSQRRFIYHDNGWGPYVAKVDVCQVPGDHDSMVLEPNVRVLAARLRASIEQAEAIPTRSVVTSPVALPGEVILDAAANDTRNESPADAPTTVTTVVVA
jgi:thioesterase domain-containing protein/acyl transferase domain-containing protein